MSLEELNDQLHSRDMHLDRTRQHDVFRPDEHTSTDATNPFQQGTTWGKESLPPKQDFGIPESVQTIIAPNEQGKHRRKMVALLLGGLALLLLIGGVIMKMRSGIFSEDNITLTLNGAGEVKSAEMTTLSVEYENDNWMGLENAVLVFEYPETFHPEAMAKLDIKKSRAEYPVGNIASQAKGKVTLSGKFYGSKGDQVKISATLRYSPSALSTLYEKHTERTVALVSSPLFLEINAPLELASDQEAQYEVHYGNMGDVAFSNLRVKLDYPTEFVFTESVPEPSESKNVWQIGTLDPRQEGTIVVRGRLTGGRDEQKLVEGSIGVMQGDGSFLSYADNSRKTKVVASPLSIHQRVNGQADMSIDPGEALHYEIEYRNDGNVGIRDAIVSLALDSSYLDLATLQFLGNTPGAYDQSRKVIFWKASDVPALARIEPGQSGRVSFDIKSFADLEKKFSGVRNPVIKSVAKIDSPDIPAIVGITKVVASATLAVKLNTVVKVSLEGRYFDSVLPNSGPMPPVVGQETSYTFHLALSNSSSEVKNTRASIVLPTGIRYTERKSPDTEQVLYNERSNELIWDPGILSPGATREFVFQLAVTPDSSSLNKEVLLISRVVITGGDAFTGHALQLEKDRKTSNLPEDKNLSSASFIVHEASQ